MSGRVCVRLSRSGGDTLPRGMCENRREEGDAVRVCMCACVVLCLLAVMLRPQPLVASACAPLVWLVWLVWAVITSPRLWRMFPLCL